MNQRTTTALLAGVLTVVCPDLAPLRAAEAPTEASPVQCAIRPGEPATDASRDVYHGAIGKLNVWVALQETEDGQLVGSYFYAKHGNQLALSGCRTAQGRFRLEERVGDQLTGVMVGDRLVREPGGGPVATTDDPPDLSGNWSSPDGKRHLPFSLWHRGHLGTYRKTDLDNLEPVPVDWPVFRAPECRFACRNPPTHGEKWHSVSTGEEWEEEPFPVCRFYRYTPVGSYSEFSPEIAIYRGTDKEAVLEKYGFVPFWTTWEVARSMNSSDVAAVATAGRLHVAWAEPEWAFQQEIEGQHVTVLGSRSEAIIEDGDTVIYFSSPDPDMWVSHLVRGLLAVHPGSSATLGEFYTREKGRYLYRQEVNSRSHRIREATYSLREEQVYGIEGLPDLHVLVYESPDLEGTLLDLARAHPYDAPDALLLLREANTDIEGQPPELDGIDVFPGENEAEIIVRWRYPGQAGLRTVEKSTATTRTASPRSTAPSWRAPAGGWSGAGGCTKRMSYLRRPGREVASVEPPRTVSVPREAP